MKHAVKTLFETILPARCPISGDIVSGPGLIAPRVWTRLDFIERPFCACCGVRFEIPADIDDLCPACLAEPPVFNRARAVFTYEEVSREMILGFKHGDQTHLTTTFIPWLVRTAAEFRDGVDLVMPVPLHRFRLLARRYNQAALLAAGLARVWDVPHDPFSLVRRKNTVAQGHMTVAERHENVTGAFAVRYADRIKGKNIVLVDDVYTTGATVSAATRVLKRAGAARVDVVTLARVMRAVRVGD